MAGLIDKESELKRLEKELNSKQAELARCEGKLTNRNFVDKAPEAIVEKERTRAAELTTALRNLEDQRKKIQAI